MSVTLKKNISKNIIGKELKNVFKFNSDLGKNLQIKFASTFLCILRRAGSERKNQRAEIK